MPPRIKEEKKEFSLSLVNATGGHELFLALRIQDSTRQRKVTAFLAQRSLWEEKDINYWSGKRELPPQTPPVLGELIVL